MNGAGLTFVMDIDGTICPIKRADQCYEDLVPYQQIVEKCVSTKNQAQNSYYLHLEI